MRFQTLTVLGLSAVALASPEVARRQDASDLSALASAVTALPSDVVSNLGSAASDLASLLPPSSILSVLETAIPVSVLTALADPAAASSFASAVAAGSTPGWYASLPGDVKSYLSSYAQGLESTIDSAASQITQDASSFVSSVNAAATSAASAASAATTGSSTPTGSSSATGATSTGGASKSHLAGGILGVAGVLGLAIAL